MRWQQLKHGPHLAGRDGTEGDEGLRECHTDKQKEMMARICWLKRTDTEPRGEWAHNPSTGIQSEAERARTGENREEDNGSALTSATTAAGSQVPHSPLFSLFCSMMLYCSCEPISCFCCCTEVGFQQCFSFTSPPPPSPPPLPPVPRSEFMLLPMMEDWMSWVVA